MNNRFLYTHIIIFPSEGSITDLMALYQYKKISLYRYNTLSIPVRSVGADLRPRNCSPYFHWRRSAPHDHATPFLTSLRLPALPRPRFGVNELGMSRATILESGVVIRFEFFQLQPFKVDQFFRGFFRDFLTLIKL